MDNELCVSCHAPSLSLLLFETVRSVHDQRGLLIGEVCREIISEKTDENEMNREQRTTIYLEHCIPVKDDLFGRIGTVNKQKLQNYVDQYCGKIVGWYSFRRNTRVNSRTLNETLIHKSLIQSIHHIRPEHFVGAFLSARIGGNYSTHTFNQLFTRFHPVRGVFEPLKLKIYTMSDKIISVNGYSIRNTFPTSKNFENIINPSEEEASPVMTVLTINKAISEYLKIINRQLQEAEKSRYELEQEIKNLRKRLMSDKLQEIKVGEVDREPEPVRVQYMRYNANISYNPDRKENPIKIIPIYYTPRVPGELDEAENDDDEKEMKKFSFSGHPPGFKCSKNGSPRRVRDSTGSLTSHFASRVHDELPVFDLNSPAGSTTEHVSEGNNHVRIGDPGPDCDGREQSILQSEKSKVTGPI